MYVEFQFTDDTLLSLTKTLAAFPVKQREKEMPIIRLGHTINQVRLENIEKLLRVCQDKIVIDLQGTDLKAIFERSKYSDLLVQKDTR